MGKNIDAVITWVDGSDSVWREKYAAEAQKRWKNRDPQSARFGNFGEVELCIKSIRKFAPWVRTIYLVTDNQCPDWLSDVEMRNSLEVVVVSHQEIFMDLVKYPTFNSTVIESQLYRIPGISSNFLYFNDDCALGRAVKKTWFLSGGRGVCDLIPSHGIGGGRSVGNQKFWGKSIDRAHQLVDGKWGSSLPWTTCHQMTLMNKRACVKTWQFFGRELRKSCQEPFRKDAKFPLNFVLLSQLVGAKLGLISVRSAPSGPLKMKNLLRLGSSAGAKKELSSIRKSRPHLFCVNSLTPESASVFREFVQSFV